MKRSKFVMVAAIGVAAIGSASCTNEAPRSPVGQQVVAKDLGRADFDQAILIAKRILRQEELTEYVICNAQFDEARGVWRVGAGLVHEDRRFGSDRVLVIRSETEYQIIPGL